MDILVRAPVRVQVCVRARVRRCTLVCGWVTCPRSPNRIRAYRCACAYIHRLGGVCGLACSLVLCVRVCVLSCRCVCVCACACVACLCARAHQSVSVTECHCGRITRGCASVCESTCLCTCPPTRAGVGIACSQHVFARAGRRNCLAFRRRGRRCQCTARRRRGFVSASESSRLPVAPLVTVIPQMTGPVQDALSPPLPLTPPRAPRPPSGA